MENLTKKVLKNHRSVCPHLFRAVCAAFPRLQTLTAVAASGCKAVVCCGRKRRRTSVTEKEGTSRDTPVGTGELLLLRDQPSDGQLSVRRRK